MTEKRAPHGANVLIKLLDKYLITQRKDGRLEITGGGLNPNELPMKGAEREGIEETGLLLSNLKFVGVYNQRVPGNTYPFGFVFLFLTNTFSLYVGEKRWDSTEIVKGQADPYQFVLDNLTLDPEEVANASFMSLEEILQQKDSFGTAYLRMILRASMQPNGSTEMGFLSEEVTFQNQKY